ncbi:unnamed protein product [Calicophoron daubneyi]|uniref:Uncharacterized protein n=1 Tax=Calicophoron daubneyi TaxID=300641 RepID=A0AAV2TJR1_CALDB
MQMIFRLILVALFLLSCQGSGTSNHHKCRLTLYFKPQCSGCEKFKPKFYEISENPLFKHVHFTTTDCSLEESSCIDISWVPQVRLFVDDELVREYKRPEEHSDPVGYLKRELLEHCGPA